jgi:hypothetical protein
MLVFKIGGPKLHSFENRGTKSAFKPGLFYKKCDGAIKSLSG